MKLPHRSLALCALLGLGACGGGGDAADTSALGGSSVLMTVRSEAAGADCANGGSRIGAGFDANGNGLLDAAEITSTQYVCNGVDGAAGLAGAAGATTLVQMSAEPAGLACPTGGKKISAGADRNANGVLDTAELSSSGFVCNGTGGANGSNGATGATGTAGLNSLVALGVEAAGANCSLGGSKLTAGLDANANNVLDGAEITTTSYVCNGAPGPGVTWVDVSTTSVQAESNKGYLANNIDQVTITLPANPSFGGLVQISGVGAGGWKVAQNAGQTVETGNLLGGRIGESWIARESNRSWASLASSANGTRLIAAHQNGQLYTSTDSGLSWTARESIREWYSVASSADGTRLVAAGVGQIYTSTDSGVTWTARESFRFWLGVASSADGTRLVAVGNNTQIYTSTDSGVSWTARDTARNWEAVASSADGTRLVASVPGGQLYTSTDSGVSWTARESNRNWYGVASSADGTRLVAVVNNGQIYTSTDSGVSWSARESNRGWYKVASSSDGSRLVAPTLSGQIYLSTDSGLSWTARESNRVWAAVASSADGARLAAAASGGQIYTSSPTPASATSPGITGSIQGRTYDVLDLQYVGNGRFIERNSAGVFDVR